MKILIVVGIVALFTFSVWYAKKKGATAVIKPESITVQTELDTPIDFGYKIFWFAVKTDQKQNVASILDLKNMQDSNWESGIKKAYENGIFITPQIGEWTLAVGMKLPAGDQTESIDKLEKLLNQLSAEFGEAQFFGTHRVVDYHSWMKSVNGEIVRIYAYLGESGKNLKVLGERTEPEIELNLFDSFSKEAESEEYWEKEDLDYPNEDLVMKIAQHWSVNPTRLTERTDIKNELGIIGE